MSTELITLKREIETQISALQSQINTIDQALRLLRDNTTPREPRKRIGELVGSVKDIVGSDWITPAEVRNELMRRSQQDLSSKQKNTLLAAVSTTLKRLTKSTLESRRIEGKPAYRVRATLDNDSQFDPESGK